MAMKREYGKEQPGIRLGMFVLRIPFVHYRIELPELFQAILMCATCLGAIPVIQEQLGMPFEIAWGMVIINGFLYTLHVTWGDPVVPGWITPSIPLTIGFLATAPMGPERIRLMCALQLMVAAIFIIMGITGIANKLLAIVPASIKSGILMGAGFAAIFGEFAPGKRIEKLPITILIGALVAFFCLFSQVFSAWRKKSKFWDAVGGLGMLPSLIVCIIVGVISKEIVYDKFDVFPILYTPDFKGIWNSMSPFVLGWPTGEMFLKAIPQAIVTYIIAFGDFVTSEALLHEADIIRQDEKIVFDANRSNIISGVRNAIEGVVCPYPTLCGPLWAAVTASVSQRYKDGRDKMDSIYSGVGTFRWMTFISVAVTAIVSFVQPILPTALSLTLLVQGFICVRLAIDLCENDTDKGLAGVMGGVILARGAAWGLAVGIVLYIALYSRTMMKEERRKNLEESLKKEELNEKAQVE